MSFNQNTKINNLYQIISPLNDIQDILGNFGGDVSSNFSYSNDLTLQGIEYTYDTINLGTITKPQDFTTTLSTKFDIHITGETNALPAGFAEVGAWIKDINGNIVANLVVGNNRDLNGQFDINNTTTLSLSPLQFPLSVQEYVYYIGWGIFGNATPFTCNVTMTIDYPPYYPLYYNPITNKIAYSSV